MARNALRLAALAAVAALLAAGMPQATHPEELQQVPVEDPGLEDQVAGVAGNETLPLGNATQDAGAAPGPDGAGLGSDGIAGDHGEAGATLGRRATEWAFDLPLLQAQREHLRSVAGDGSPRANVTIHVTWTDLAGTPQPLPGGDGPSMRLHMRHGGVEQVFDPRDAGEANSTFRVPLERLVRTGSAAWEMEVEAVHATTPGLGAARSPYDRDGPREAAHVHWSGGSAVWIHDSDGDGVPDDGDNCPGDANPHQEDLDGDRAGDVCDEDDDGDGWPDGEEATAGSDPRDPASTPDDRDGDGYDNTLEAEEGSDPDDPVSTPQDRDADGHPARVEDAAGSDDRDPLSTPTDPDADGIPTNQDTCPRVHDPDQGDGDGDGIGDACDARPDDGPLGDHDGDGVPNIDDTCPRHADPGQEDQDGDGLGDACEDDTDGDGHADVDDVFPRDPAEWRDGDGDGVGDNADGDDDNDGLSDDAEAAIGTDPLDPDSDGDRYSDLDELRMGSEPTDPFDPPFLPTGAEASAGPDGIVISWQAAGDPRVTSHVVWEAQSRRVVAVTQGASVLDAAPDGTGYYAIQPLFEGEPVDLDGRRSVHALAAQVLRDRLDAVPTAPAAGASAGETAPAPVEDVPLAPWLAAVALVLAAWRRGRVA